MRPASQQFLDSLMAYASKTSKYAINPDDNEEIILNDTVAVEMVPVTPNWVHFLSIRALRPQQGDGTVALNKIMKIADDTKINFIGKIRSYDTKAMSKHQLRKWYRKIGGHPLDRTNPDGFWVRIRNETARDEILSLDKEQLKKIDEGLSDYDHQLKKVKKGLLLVGALGFLLWKSSN